MSERAPASSALSGARQRPRMRRRLFVKYVGLFIAVVSVALLLNGAFEVWFLYREQKAALVRIQHEQAEAAAAKIEQFFKGIESQLGWTTQLPLAVSTLEQRRFDSLRLLRQVPAITELWQLDSSGKEQLRVSRLAMDVIGGGADFSKDPRFTEALARKIYYGPVYFRRESEPYLTMAVAGARRDAGVSVAEVNLKLIWDVVSAIKVGQRGRAYVVDAQGRLIAHPDLSLVLRNTDLSHLPQVQAARGGGAGPAQVQEAEDQQGNRVLTAYAPVAPLNWFVFVELPVEEAYGPLYESLRRLTLLLLAALCLAALAGMFLARRMVVPIHALRTGAARIGGGDLNQRIRIDTGDELEALADQFNEMAEKLQESYAHLESKVEDRTRELARSVEELRALGVVSQAVSSTLDLQTVLSTIVAKAVQLSGTEAGAIYVYSTASQTFRLRAVYGMDDQLIAAIGSQKIRIGETAIGMAAARGEPVQIPDLRDEPSPVHDIIIEGGFRALLAVPLLRSGRIVGALVVRRREPGVFTQATIDLMQTFAAQSVLAIQNARLFTEIEEKRRELEIASRHKSQFLANMSHELRTPMNAVLGFAEMLADGIYGDLPERAKIALERVQANGRHLLGLINDVLDLSKIEAGQLTLNFEEYSMAQILQSVLASTEPLAAAKGLKLTASLQEPLPMGRGDERRLTQVLLNLVGNAIKFTEAGSVEIAAEAADGVFKLAVRDTGPGIAPEDQKRIFEEFQQVDSSSTRKTGGTGLGLAISKHLIEMHGGSIEVESALGVGSTFRIALPVRTVEKKAAA